MSVIQICIGNMALMAAIRQRGLCFRVSAFVSLAVHPFVCLCDYSNTKCHIVIQFLWVGCDYWKKSLNFGKHADRPLDAK